MPAPGKNAPTHQPPAHTPGAGAGVAAAVRAREQQHHQQLRQLQRQQEANVGAVGAAEGRYGDLSENDRRPGTSTNTYNVIEQPSDTRARALLLPTCARFVATTWRTGRPPNHPSTCLNSYVPPPYASLKASKACG